MNKEDIKWAHVELTSRCNAWCPACNRNNDGFGQADGLVEQDLSTDRLEEILSSLPNLHAVQLCGNYGDPIIAANILDAVTLIKKYAEKIQIHTNGSLRNVTWWANFADLLNDIDHDVWFGIDGLSGVHEIYRQGTDFDKIIENATAFIDVGGYATWQFIPYAHNEHQLRDCLKLSQKLKFKKFKLAKLYRDKRTVKHYRTGEEFELLPPKEVQSIIRMPKYNQTVNKTDCMHLTQPSVYVTASGKINSCCYHGSLGNPQFDSVDELLYNNLDLTVPICLFNCGS
jgi:sulfatase maturation enzyme AslB (radical SAM superfamily)